MSSSADLIYKSEAERKVKQVEEFLFAHKREFYVRDVYSFVLPYINDGIERMALGARRLWAASAPSAAADGTQQPTTV